MTNDNELVQTPSGLIVPSHATQPKLVRKRERREEGKLFQRLMRLASLPTLMGGWDYNVAMSCKLCTQQVELKRNESTGECVLACGCTLRLLEQTYVSKEGVI